MVVQNKSETLKPPNSVPRTAVFELNGRIVKKNDCPVAVQTTEATSKKDISVPSEPLAFTEDRLLKEQISQDILQRDGSIIIRTVKTVSLDNTTTATLTEISGKPSSFKVGDNRFIQAIFNYIYEEDNMPSSRVREGDQPKKIASRCTFVNICEKESSDEKPKRRFPLGLLDRLYDIDDCVTAWHYSVGEL